jgi:2,4-dienoyl-CoA reductase-like NADH-dependent reductase (Old Yellow Enzyme family)
VRGATTAQLARVVDDFRRATRVAIASGFDAVEVHLGHGYLLSSFLSPNLNRRSDRYGGDLEGRSRFPREVVRAVREEAGDRLAVLAKLNMADGVPGGLWLDEAVEVARMLEADGALDAIELSGGSSFLNAMYFFRGEVPLRDIAATRPTATRPFVRIVGPRLFPSYPFEEAFFLPYARQVRAAVGLPLVLLGGVNRLDTVQRGLDEGFELVAMARALLRQPDLVERMRTGTATEGLCVHCNKCTPTIYSGTRCVLVPEPATTSDGGRA